MVISYFVGNVFPICYILGQNDKSFFSRLICQQIRFLPLSHCDLYILICQWQAIKSSLMLKAEINVRL